MKTLVLGAGGIGGYFGGVAALAGRDVTFLVRERRAQQLRANGLVIKTASGVRRIVPQMLTAGAHAQRFDLIVLSCKAYDLQSAIEAIEPFVGEQTAVLPLLNGLMQYDVLDARFGPASVLGGFCQIGVTMTLAGEIQRMSAGASLVLGERDATTSSARANEVAARLGADGAEVRVSTQFMHDAWGKFVFLGALAAATCLLRGTIGQIQATRHGKRILRAILDEVCAVAAGQGFAQTPEFIEHHRRLFETDGSTSSSSMYRDLLAGNRVEAEHILGDLVSRAERSGQQVPNLCAAYCQLQLYDRGRVAAETAATSTASD